MNQTEIDELEEKHEEMSCDGFIEEDEDVAQVNELARLFYYDHGYQIEKGYDFESASHPQEQRMFSLALIAFNYVRNVGLR